MTDVSCIVNEKLYLLLSSHFYKQSVLHGSFFVGKMRSFVIEITSNADRAICSRIHSSRSSSFSSTNSILCDALSSMSIHFLQHRRACIDRYWIAFCVVHIEWRALSLLFLTITRFIGKFITRESRSRINLWIAGRTKFNHSLENFFNNIT